MSREDFINFSRRENFRSDERKYTDKDEGVETDWPHIKQL